MAKQLGFIGPSNFDIITPVNDFLVDILELIVNHDLHWQYI
jgi:hypothetical protein